MFYGFAKFLAFLSDNGSDLSFALALLDNQNNGVLLNGIYSREMSNIYAKPIYNGESPYALSEEEIDKMIAVYHKFQEEQKKVFEETFGGNEFEPDFIATQLTQGA